LAMHACIHSFNCFFLGPRIGRINDLMLYVDLELKGRGPPRRAGHCLNLDGFYARTALCRWTPEKIY
jgi:hypothetical protein